MEKGKSLRPTGSRAWVEIDRAAIRNNYGIFRGLLRPATRLMSVVKSNAYGHGLMDFAEEVETLGADWLGVDTIVEGLLLRREGRRVPILALGYTLPEKLEEALSQNISIAVSSIEHLKMIKACAGKLAGLKVHIKTDTGMHRQGFQLHEIEAAMKFIKQYLTKINVEGLFTHFAAAKNPSLTDRTAEQYSIFKEMIHAVKKYGHNPLCHASATGGALTYPSANFDMVRIGIGMYGIWPSPQVRAAFEKKIKLRPVLSWKTLIGEVKTISEDGAVGYDFTELVRAGSKIAVCPVGYWHGLPRALSSVGSVSVHGTLAKIIGRVSMDMIVVDVSRINNVKSGDEVVLVGKGISADDVAGWADTSPYEIVTRINPFTKRVYC